MSKGGRPKDTFVNEHTIEYKDDRGATVRKCKYCDRLIKGSVTRARNHLSGQGNDISKCEYVPKEVREKARQKTPGKRPLEEVNGVGDHSPCLSNEEFVTNALLKFLMCYKLSSVDADLLKEPYFRDFLERAHQNGVPFSLLRGDSLVIEKSLLNIDHELRQYMSMVKESWKKTGCTLMAFNLNHGHKGNAFTLEQDRYVYVFYCPKGFIFVEAPDRNTDCIAFSNALEKHSPSLSYDDAWSAIFLHHSINYGSGDDHLCELSDKKHPIGIEMLPCLRHEIQGLCIDMCKGSEWAQSLINRAVEIHERLFHRHHELTLRCWYVDLIMQKNEDSKKEEYSISKDSSRLPTFLSNFISFMLLGDKLIKELSYKVRSKNYVPDRAYLEAILDDSKFWGDGRHLLRILTMTLRIPGVMDTLIPTAGYLAAAIDFVNYTFMGKEDDDDDCDPLEGENAIAFWKDLESKLRDTIKGRRVAACYLNPYYFVTQDVQKQIELLDKLKLVFTYKNGYLFGGGNEKLNEELQNYSDECNKQREDGLLYEDIHPVKWWEENGDDLPLLKKKAIRFLSQPLNCMCNQVKKNIYELQGANDFILRLNVRMMEEFKLLGDDIYKPINLSELEDGLL